MAAAAAAGEGPLGPICLSRPMLADARRGRKEAAAARRLTPVRSPCYLFVARGHRSVERRSACRSGEQPSVAIRARPSFRPGSRPGFRASAEHLPPAGTFVPAAEIQETANVPGGSGSPGMRYAGLGIELVAAVGLLALGGWWIDGRFGTAPWGLAVGALLGLVGGMAHLVRTAMSSVRPPADGDGSRG